MKYFFILFILFMFFSCSNTCESCLSRQIESHSKQVQYDFLKESEVFFSYLISIGLIRQYDKDNLLEFIHNKKYCSINYEEYIATIDNSFATSPIIGGAYASCIQKSELPCGFELELDFEALGLEGADYFNQVISDIDRNDIDNKYVKLFCFYEINILMGLCNHIE